MFIGEIQCVQMRFRRQDSRYMVLDTLAFDT
jgi:hypothetical protein